MSRAETVLKGLRTNARAQLTYLAYKAGMPVSTTFNKVKELESSVIKKHTSLIDFRKLGFQSWAKLVVKVERMQRDKLMRYAQEHENVNSLFEINNGYDFLIEVIHKDRKELADFMDLLREKFEIKQIMLIDIVRDIKREEFLTE